METNMKFTMPLAVYAVAFALVACSDDGDGGTNGFNFSNNDADSYSTSDDGSIPLNPSSILPGSDKGTVEYEKEYVCPIEGYDATAKSSCKIYSDGNSVSLVFNVFGSHDGESLNVVMSSIADLDKLVMDMNIVADAVGGSDIKNYSKEMVRDLCSEYKQALGAQGSADCGGDKAYIRAPLRNGLVRSDLIESWKDLCQQGCNIF